MASGSCEPFSNCVFSLEDLASLVTPNFRTGRLIDGSKPYGSQPFEPLKIMMESRDIVYYNIKKISHVRLQFDTYNEVKAGEYFKHDTFKYKVEKVEGNTVTGIAISYLGRSYDYYRCQICSYYSGLFPELIRTLPDGTSYFKGGEEDRKRFLKEYKDMLDHYDAAHLNEKKTPKPPKHELGTMIFTPIGGTMVYTIAEGWQPRFPSHRRRRPTREQVSPRSRPLSPTSRRPQNPTSHQ